MDLKQVLQQSAKPQVEKKPPEKTQTEQRGKKCFTSPRMKTEGTAQETDSVNTIEPRKTTDRRTLKYEFSPDELRDMARDLARSIQEFATHEDALQSVKADFKAKMDSLTATINRISMHINNGYEFRLIECLTEYHVPRDGMKRVTRQDTGLVVDEVKMAPQEMQEPLLKE